MLRARLDAAGAPLERAIERTPTRREDWPAAVRRAAAALEESWDELEQVARAELLRWDATAGVLESWRLPRGLWIGAVAVLGLAAGWVGLALGGWVPRPGWLDPLAEWFWSLPWP
jgi:hypothetical protein